MTNTDGVVCGFCGSLMVRTGACYTCPSCGESTGCGKQLIVVGRGVHYPLEPIATATSTAIRALGRG